MQPQRSTENIPQTETAPKAERLAYSIQESADLLGVNYFSVYRLIQRGKLPGGGLRRNVWTPSLMAGSTRMAGSPLYDPLRKSIAEVHVYLDQDASGGTTEIVRTTVARERIAVALNEAKSRGYKIFVGEIGFYAGNEIASAAWADFIAYAKAKARVLTGFAWWAAGTPGWWDDVAANGGGHFSISPTSAGAVYSGDTINMNMIENDFL
jgi:hypothetical protein